MALLLALGVFLLGVVLVGFGIVTIEYPQAAYRVRHWPGTSSEDALTTAGESTERTLGYLWVLLGGFGCVAGVVILL
jgi:hypothetical protein